MREIFRLGNEEESLTPLPYNFSLKVLK